jgi:hypothetical protein
MSSHNESEDAELQSCKLLRNAGILAQAPLSMMREVQAAVHAEWRKVVAMRRQRRTIMFVAASICALAVGATIGLQLMNEASEVAPAFVIENASLVSFLRWIARSRGARSCDETKSDVIEVDFAAAIDSGLNRRPTR